MAHELEVPQEKHPFRRLKTRLYVVNPWFLLGIFALAYIAFDFFSMAGQEFLLTHLGADKITWKGYLMVSAVLLGILYLVTKISKIPLIDFEQI